MYYYKATVRLNGNTMNEVVKILSAPELLVLQFVHGGDAITNVRYIKQAKVRMMDEKQRLQSLYDNALLKREQSIDNIFGALGVLPDRLPEHLMERYGLFDDSEINEEDIMNVARQKSKDPSVRMNQPKDQVEFDREETVFSEAEVDVADLMRQTYGT